MQVAGLIANKEVRKRYLDNWVFRVSPKLPRHKGNVLTNQFVVDAGFVVDEMEVKCTLRRRYASDPQ
jgi:hypothetical protein